MMSAGDENGNMKLSVESHKVTFINWQGWLNMCGWYGRMTRWKKGENVENHFPNSPAPLSRWPWTLNFGKIHNFMPVSNS